MSDEAPKPVDKFQDMLKQSIEQAKARQAEDADRPRATLTLSDVVSAARIGATWGTIAGLVIVAVMGGLVGLLIGGVMYYWGAAGR